MHVKLKKVISMISRPTLDNFIKKSIKNPPRVREWGIITCIVLGMSIDLKSITGILDLSAAVQVKVNIERTFEQSRLKLGQLGLDVNR